MAINAPVLLTLSTITAALVIFFTLIFTEVGFGATIFRDLVHGYVWAHTVAIGGIVIISVLYLADFSHWTSYTWAQSISAGIFLVTGSIYTFMNFKHRPYAPILVFFIACAAMFAFIYYNRYKKLLTITVSAYMINLAMAILLGAGGLFITALIFSAQNDFWWGSDTKREFRDRLRVCEDSTVRENGYCDYYGSTNSVKCREGCVEVEWMSACPPGVEHCLAAFVLFAGPFILALCMAITGVVLLVLGWALERMEKASGDQSRNRDKRLTKGFVGGVLFAIMITWVASSLAGASMDVANVVVTFAFTGVAILLAILAAVIPWSQIKENETAQQLGKLPYNDWFQAIGFYMVGPLLPPLFLVSLVNQSIRRLRGFPPVQGQTADDKNGMLTRFFQKVWSYMSEWDWTQVLIKTYWFGLGYIVLVVGVGKVVTVFLAWLNTSLAEAGVGVFGVSGIIVAIGLVLLIFIPVMPGVPMYLASGVIIVAAADKQGWNFAAASLWASFVASALKLLSVFLTQALVQVLASDNVTLKKLAGYNDKPIKAFRYIADTKQWYEYDLIICLIGGPDWPVAVVSGITKQSYLKMVAGTLPVTVPVVLTVLAGAFLAKSNDGETYAALAAVFSTMSALAFSIMSIAFLATLDRVGTESSDQFDEDDEDVKKLVDTEEEKHMEAVQAVEWGSLPWPLALILILCSVVMYMALATLVLESDTAFHEVSLTTDYRTPPLSGNVTNMVRQTGATALSMLASSVGLYILFILGVKLVIGTPTAGPQNP